MVNPKHTFYSKLPRQIHIWVSNSYWSFPLVYLIVLKLVTTNERTPLPYYTHQPKNEKSYWNHRDRGRTDSIKQTFVTSEEFVSGDSLGQRLCLLWTRQDEVEEYRCRPQISSLFSHRFDRCQKEPYRHQVSVLLLISFMAIDTLIFKKSSLLNSLCKIFRCSNIANIKWKFPVSHQFGSHLFKNKNKQNKQTKAPIPSPLKIPYLT